MMMTMKFLERVSPLLARAVRAECACARLLEQNNLFVFVVFKFLSTRLGFLWSFLLRCINMATKKRKEDEETGLDKKRRKSGLAANGAELHGATEEQQPIVSLIDCFWQQHLRFGTVTLMYSITICYSLGLSPLNFVSKVRVPWCSWSLAVVELLTVALTVFFGIPESLFNIYYYCNWQLSA